MDTHASKFLPLFIATDQVLTADALLALFKVKVWSPDGSNDREAEEAVIFNWENYIRGMCCTSFFLKRQSILYQVVVVE